MVARSSFRSVCSSEPVTRNQEPGTRNQELLNCGRERSGFLLRLVRHRLQPRDANWHRRMRAEKIGEATFARRETSAEWVGDAKVCRPFLDRRRRLVRMLDLLQRGGARQWVPCRLRTRGVWQACPWTADAEC